MPRFLVLFPNMFEQSQIRRFCYFHGTVCLDLVTEFINNRHPHHRLAQGGFEQAQGGFEQSQNRRFCYFHGTVCLDLVTEFINNRHTHHRLAQGGS